MVVVALLQVLGMLAAAYGLSYPLSYVLDGLGRLGFSMFVTAYQRADEAQRQKDLQKV